MASPAPLKVSSIAIEPPKNMRPGVLSMHCRERISLSKDYQCIACYTSHLESSVSLLIIATSQCQLLVEVLLPYVYHRTGFKCVVK